LKSRFGFGFNVYFLKLLQARNQLRITVFKCFTRTFRWRLNHIVASRPVWSEMSFPVLHVHYMIYQFIQNIPNKCCESSYPGDRELDGFVPCLLLTDAKKRVLLLCRLLILFKNKCSVRHIFHQISPKFLLVHCQVSAVIKLLFPEFVQYNSTKCKGFVTKSGLYSRSDLSHEWQPS